MTWEVLLTGPEDALTRLARVFAGPDLEVVQHDDKYMLKGEALERLDIPAAVKAEAERIAARMTGMTRVLLDSSTPIKIGGIYNRQPDGSAKGYLFAKASITTSATAELTLIHADGTREHHRPEDPMAAWMVLAQHEEHVDKALRLRSKDDLSWPDLYRLLEVIAEAMAPKAVETLNCASRAQLKAFKHSANSVSVAGDDARHGKEPHAPPARPMSIGAARAMVDAVLKAWLQSRAAT